MCKMYFDYVVNFSNVTGDLGICNMCAGQLSFVFVFSVICKPAANCITVV